MGLKNADDATDSMLLRVCERSRRKDAGGCRLRGGKGGPPSARSCSSATLTGSSWALTGPEGMGGDRKLADTGSIGRGGGAMLSLASITAGLLSLELGRDGDEICAWVSLGSRVKLSRRFSSSFSGMCFGLNAIVGSAVVAGGWCCCCWCWCLCCRGKEAKWPFETCAENTTS